MWYLVTGVLFIVHAIGQNTGHIYDTPGDSVSGSFSFPRTYPLSFREASTINVTWTTTFERVNLYYCQRGNVANSILLASKWRLVARR